MIGSFETLSPHFVTLCGIVQIRREVLPLWVILLMVSDFLIG